VSSKDSLTACEFEGVGTEKEGEDVNWLALLCRIQLQNMLNIEGLDVSPEAQRPQFNTSLLAVTGPQAGL